MHDLSEVHAFTADQRAGVRGPVSGSKSTSESLYWPPLSLQTDLARLVNTSGTVHRVVGQEIARQ